MNPDAPALADLLHRLQEKEQAVLALMLDRQRVTQDVNQVFETGRTPGERVADRVAAFGGSWTFIGLFLAAMSAWMFLNAETTKPFDPYPFILLNLVLSCLAALQAPVIMMSQNRQAARDRLDAHHDYQVNLKAEMEIMALHARLDQLQRDQWSDLIAMQERQLKALDQLREMLADPGRG